VNESTTYQRLEICGNRAVEVVTPHPSLPALPPLSLTHTHTKFTFCHGPQIQSTPYGLLHRDSFLCLLYDRQDWHFNSWSRKNNSHAILWNSWMHETYTKQCLIVACIPLIMLIILIRDPEGKKQLWRSRHRWDDIIVRCSFRKQDVHCGLDSSGSG